MKFSGTKLSWGTGCGQKAEDGDQLGGRAKFLLPGGGPQSPPGKNHALTGAAVHPVVAENPHITLNSTPDLQ